MVYIFYGNGVIKCCRHIISKQKFAALAVVLYIDSTAAQL